MEFKLQRLSLTGEYGTDTQGTKKPWDLDQEKATYVHGHFQCI